MSNFDLKDKIYEILEQVNDPEVPVLSVVDLGIIRNVEVEQNNVTITITPTYVGCPAMKTIEDDIQAAVTSNGLNSVKINTIISPAWTTDWISENGKQKLLEFGIAPPVGSASKNSLLREEKVVVCPQCKSKTTKMISQFGSTACKALYKCEDCLEPFDYFKCI